jgi:transcriptional regulator with XRE-family HTH domain
MDSKQVGKLISKLRKDNKWTQLQLSEKLFLSDKTISKWERGDGIPEVSQFPAMAKLFGVITDYLLTGEEKESVSSISNLETSC